ncbi:MAG: transposase [Lentisphaeria bacterium]
MARPLRVEFPGALYHVVNRGNRRERVFRSQADYTLFLDRLEQFAKKFDVAVLSYCLMANHFHLFLRTRQANLSRFMQSLLTSFTVVVNRRDRTSGHLFQGRFSAQLVEGEGHFDTVSRYIHLNPVRTQAARELPLVERRRMLAEFRWSSFPFLVGLAPSPAWLLAAEILDGFGNNRRDQMRAYRRYVEQGLTTDIRSPEEAANVPGILGSETFADRIKREFLLRTTVKDRREQPALAKAQGGHAFASMLAAVGETYGVTPSFLLRRGCRQREARQMAILAASEFCRGALPLAEMARKFNLSLSGFTSVRDRLERRLAGRRHPLAVPYGQIKAVLSHSRQNDEMKLIAEV